MRRSQGVGFDMYRSTFPTDPTMEAQLKGAGVMAAYETLPHMIGRVVDTLADADERFSGAAGSAAFVERLGWQVDAGRLGFSAPLLAHAARLADRPLVGCVAPDVGWPGELDDVRTMLESHVRLGLAVGLRLDQVDDPATLLHYLNHVAVVGAGGADTAGPAVQHAALLPLSHPAAERFVTANVGADGEGETWRFHVWLAATDDDLEAALHHDGRERALLLAAADATRSGPAPGLLFVDRLHAGNPTPRLGTYVATSPAGEVGLLAGETCTFGHVNLAAFHRTEPGHPVPIDLGGLADAVHVLVRALDDAVEASTSQLPPAIPVEVTETTRKLGVGVCGLADLLEAVGLDYSSREGRRLAREALSFVNYAAKLASVDLAVSRGPCPAVISGRSRYTSPGFLERFARDDLRSVTAADWSALAQRVAVSGMLRSTSVTAIVPTAPGAALVGAADGIEPRSPVEPLAQLAMAAAAQACVDEGVATTIRLPAGATEADVYDLFVAAWQLGCKSVRAGIRAA